MKKTVENILPVGAPWGGPESFKFLSCFASLFMRLEGENCVSALYCDRDIRICNQCNECGEMVWDRKCHEQIYHDFLILSGVACTTLWPENPADIRLLCGPSGFTDDDYVHRTLDFAGYGYRILQGVPKDEMRTEIVRSIDSGVPVLAYQLVNDDWCLVSGYAEDGDILLGGYVAEKWDDPARKPDWAEEGAFSRRIGITARSESSWWVIRRLPSLMPRTCLAF
jgi:hypothetical protein